MKEDPPIADPEGRRRGLVERFRAGDPAALARAISVVENEEPGFEALLDELHPATGRAHRIGITGPPGAGKSTLVAGLARRERDAGRRVGVLAVDPSSPFSGGALLGDRIRMSELATEPGIFIRSMASRGSLGGLAAAARAAADLMDAFGFDRVLIETVGVGQSELEIATSADTTVLVLVPESGDGIQAMKAGLMEVADLFAVNKADRPGADRLRKEIELSRALAAGHVLRGVPAHHGVDLSRIRRGPAGEPEGRGPEAWSPPVVMCIGSTGKGIEELAEAIDAHRGWLERSGELATRRRAARLEQARAVLLRALERRARQAWEVRLGAAPEATPDESPYALARAVLEELEGAEEGAGDGPVGGGG